MPDSIEDSPHRPPGMPLVWGAILCFVVSMAMHLPWLGITPLAGTEGHRVLSARGMIANHWWLVPTLYGRPFMTKPPLHYWLIAWSAMLGKDTLFFWRLPSAVAGGLVCSLACLFGGRWFGRWAGLIAGLSAAGLISLWGQNQTADIDATNTLFSGLAALCGIEMLFGTPRRRWGWIIGAGLALAGMLMTKGPAGLPIIVGVWLTAAIATKLERRSNDLLSPCYWMPIVIGLALFILYTKLAQHSLTVHKTQLDRRGLQEGLTRLYPKSLSVLAESLFVMLPQVMAYGLPVSASLLFLRDPDVRVMLPGRQMRIAGALAVSVLMSWAVCFISGMINPRYAYVTYLPLCPLAGAMAVATARSRQAIFMRVAIVGTAIALAIGTAVLTWACYKAKAPPDAERLMILCSGLAVVAAIGTILRISRLAKPSGVIAVGDAVVQTPPILVYADVQANSVRAWSLRPTRWDAGWGLVLLMLLISLPFGLQRHLSRSRDSGIGVAYTLEGIVAPGSVVAAGETILWRPEIFFYAQGIRPEFHPYSCFPESVKPGRWVMMDSVERTHWLHQPGVVLEQDQKIYHASNGIDYYLAWYANPPVPARMKRAEALGPAK